MAMKIVQQNIASEFQSLAAQLISIKHELNSLVNMYANESMAALTDADFAQYPDVSHIVAVEFQAAAGALSAINTELGDFSAGTNVSKLLRIVKGVPK